MTHICVGKLTIIGPDNGLSPERRQAIIWTNAGILLIGPLGTNFSEILIEILTFSFKKMRMKVSSAKRRPFCLGLNVLMNAPSGFKPQYVQVTFACTRLKCFLWPKGFRDVRDYELFIPSLNTICSIEWKWTKWIDHHSHGLIIALNMKCTKTKRTVDYWNFLYQKCFDD